MSFLPQYLVLKGGLFLIEVFVSIPWLLFLFWLEWWLNTHSFDIWSNVHENSFWPIPLLRNNKYKFHHILVCTQAIAPLIEFAPLPTLDTKCYGHKLFVMRTKIKGKLSFYYQSFTDIYVSIKICQKVHFTTKILCRYQFTTIPLRKS